MDGKRVYQGMKLDGDLGCRLETHETCVGPLQDKIWDIQATGERQPNTLVRSQLGWTKVTAWAALTTLLLFATLNWRGCWLFRNEPQNLAVFFYPFAWLVLFFAVRTRWRLVLLLVTIPALVVYANGRWGLVEMNSGAESAAFQALHQMQSSISASRAEHQQKDYPDTLPSINLSPYAQKYYRFEYIPRRSPNGEVVGYIIQATPARRDCEFHRSFTITDEGRVFWTLEPRAATLSDMYYSE
jgi:hypothetical protein